MDPLAVDERAVGTVQVGDGVIVADAADFGMVAGDFACRGAGCVLDGSRPTRMVASFSSKRLPWSAPRMTNSVGTAQTPAGIATQQFFDFTDQRSVMIGLGHKFPLGRLVAPTAQTA